MECMDPQTPVPLKTHLVSTTDSPGFTDLTSYLTRSTIIGLDAEWKPIRFHQPTYPTVSLLQLACQLGPELAAGDSIVVLLVDLASIPLDSIWVLLRDVFVSNDVLKLGFRFKQDLIYLSSTFSSQGCDPGFDRVEPYLDIMSIYQHLQQKQHGKKTPKETKSLASICKELLGISLSKKSRKHSQLWMPIACLKYSMSFERSSSSKLLLPVNHTGIVTAGILLHSPSEPHPPIVNVGLKQVLEKLDICNKVVKMKVREAVDMVRATDVSNDITTVKGTATVTQHRNTQPMDEFLLKVVSKYGENISLGESDNKAKATKRKGKKRSSVGYKQRQYRDHWKGPAPWDLTVGGDGHPKFLCDVMVEGLAKHLRCVGIDAASPYSKKPESRELIDHAIREKRVLLTLDAKLLRYEYLIQNQIYRVKSLLKNEQLLEVIETFQLNVSEDQLMSRCTRCNGRFIQNPLSTEEAIKAVKGFQRIPNCLFDKNLQFWPCMDCNQLYWEGTQYHNAVQKFIDVCKLNDTDCAQRKLEAAPY